MIRLSAFKWLSLAVVAVTALAVPRSGDYAAMEVMSWKEDALSEQLGNLNQLLCAFNSINPHQNVDRGVYLSRVNYSTCAQGATPSATDIWLDVTARVKKSTRSSNEYIAEYWFNYANEGNVYAEYIVKQGANSSSINGIFELNICVVWNQETNCGLKVAAVSDGNIVEIHTNESRSTPFTRESDLISSAGSISHLVANVGTSRGYGLLLSRSFEQLQNGSSYGSDLELKFAFKDIDVTVDYIKDRAGNNNNWTDSPNSGNKVCSSRKETDGVITVYDYRLFRANGSEVKLAYPQLSYRVLTDSNTYLKNGTDIIGARLMQSSMAYDSGLSEYRDQTDPNSISDKETVLGWLQANPARKLYAEPFQAGAYERMYEIAITPGQQSVYVKNELGQPYVVTEGVNLSFTPILNQNIQGLDTAANPGINNVPQALIFMGNGYINGIPWNQSDAYTILDGAAMSGTGSDSGTTFYVRPKFYSVRPGARPCDPAVDQLLASAESLRNRIPTDSSYTSLGTLVKPWIDPRQRIGNKPSTSGLSIKYLNGKPA
jgi:hypothetical protein